MSKAEERRHRLMNSGTAPLSRRDKQDWARFWCRYEPGMAAAKKRNRFIQAQVAESRRRAKKGQ